MITAKLFCLVMFGFKIILKMGQKVDVSYEFLRKFIFHLEDKQYGKELMTICLNVGEEIVEKIIIIYLKFRLQNIEKTEICLIC